MKVTIAGNVKDIAEGTTLAQLVIDEKVENPEYVTVTVNDEFVEKTVDAVIEGARTGDIGDGKIFVLPMDDCIRIRTGERGPKAIG